MRALAPEQTFEISTAVHEYVYIAFFHAIHNNVIANGKAPVFVSEIVVSQTANMGKAAQSEKTVSNEVHSPVCDLNAAALACDVKPDFVQVGFGARRHAVAHLSESRLVP